MINQTNDIFPEYYSNYITQRDPKKSLNIYEDNKKNKPRSIKHLTKIANALSTADLSTVEIALKELFAIKEFITCKDLINFRSSLKRKYQLNRLWAVLSSVTETTEQKESENMWRSVMNPDSSSCSVDQLIELDCNNLIAYGWCSPDMEVEVIARGRWGTWTLVKIIKARITRPDVAEAIGLETWRESGFVVSFKLPEGEPLSDLWIDGTKVIKSSCPLGETSYIQTVQTLLRLCHLKNTSIEMLPKLMNEVFGKTLLRLRESLQDQNTWRRYIELEQKYGRNTVGAEISIVVPLYRRWDLVLGQLAAFSMDEIFQKGKVKIIYVIDDPSIQSEFLVWCNKHMQQESLGIEVISLRKNMGFAMACNIGIQYADTDLVCLLNSDILPSQPGWLVPLLATHQEKQNALIAPLLMYENGLIQHAGMEVDWKGAADGLPICFHPLKGLHIEQLSQIHKDIAYFSVNALSGAALFFNQKCFLNLGGFDPAFGSGDFEDLEFSLRWKRTQAELLMVPNSKLIHLEGQSICRKPDLWTSWRQGCNAWLAKELCPESKAQSL